jgi:hypothetical protein
MCTECQTIEGPTGGAIDDQGNEAEVCKECGAYDSIKYYDEDYGKDE